MNAHLKIASSERFSSNLDYKLRGVEVKTLTVSSVNLKQQNVKNPYLRFPSEKNAYSSFVGVSPCIESTMSITGTLHKKPNKDKEHILTFMLQSDEYESGLTYASEEYFVDWLKENKDEAMQSVASIFYKHYQANQAKEANIVIGILHMLSHLPYKSVFPIGQILAKSALSHENLGICDFALKCFDNWENKDSLATLKAVKFHAEWLQEYANSIISHLESR